MSSRLRERRSSLATWSSRLALVSIPILVIVAIGHRSGLMSATQAYASMALGFGLAGLAVLAALGALEGIWRDGRKGLGSAIAGLLVGLAVLVLPLAGAWHLMSYPQLIDISTDLEDPPAFLLAAADRPADARPVTDPSEDDADVQREAYPDIVPRHYPVGTARVFEDAKVIVDRRGWRLLGARPPTETAEAGWIEAVAATPVFGFRQDVAIRILPDGEGALVDVRSAARNGAHDLGANAERIRAFFRDLDASLQGISEE
ncbi:DUF1499 domain-containing protein [Bauldia litoralis]|uniref:DUF1499 domain-containing protein n=1 Tax=Bauldia litoralis TaxID=665467 RepID=A0A1G6C9D0_9HYPH|nr:DUF1499 domain-containing protein [Bauldia litoralis]SDB29477.1 Protein of unknown function [Bauldia litoralis]